MPVDYLPRFRACANKKRLDWPSVESAMYQIEAVWGQPHLHSGRGIRSFGGGIFEGRLGRDWRLVFRPQGNVLVFLFLGTHSEVQKYLRNR